MVNKKIPISISPSAIFNQVFQLVGTYSFRVTALIYQFRLDKQLVGVTVTIG